MAKIKRVTKSGEPGFSTRSVSGWTGRKVSADREGKRSVRILLRRDPAKNQSDPLNFTNHARVPNPNAVPSPRILNGTVVGRAQTLKNGVKQIVNRGTNRRITKR